MLDAHDLPVGLKAAVGVFGERSSAPAARPQLLTSLARHRVVTQGIEPVLGKGLAAAILLVATRIVEVLVGVALVLEFCTLFLVGCRRPVS